MPSICFESEGSSSGNGCAYRYGIICYMQGYKQSCRQKSVFGSYVKYTLLWAGLVARKLSGRYSNSDHNFGSMLLVTVTATSHLRIFKFWRLFFLIVDGVVYKRLFKKQFNGFKSGDIGGQTWRSSPDRFTKHGITKVKHHFLRVSLLAPTWT
jgi:hypothetical protein